MPGSGIATEAGIVTLRLLRGPQHGGKPAGHSPGCMSDVDVETAPQCSHAPQHAETRRSVASIHYRTNFLDLQAFGFTERFFRAATYPLPDASHLTFAASFCNRKPPRFQWPNFGSKILSSATPVATGREPWQRRSFGPIHPQGAAKKPSPSDCFLEAPTQTMPASVGQSP